METVNIDKIDIYEVEKADYDAYYFRLPKNDLVKTTPRENLTVFRDMVSGQQICGYETIELMGQECRRFFIFNFIDEERLGTYKTQRRIVLSPEEYEKFLKSLPTHKTEVN